MAKIPSSMLAVVAPQPDGAEELALVERRVPRPGPDEVLIKVAAAGINRPDILQRRGLYPPPPGAPDILGLEIAGEVVEAGEGRRRAARAAFVRARRWRRLCRILRCPGRHLPPGSRGDLAGRGRGDARDLVHRLGQSCSSAALPPMATGCWSTAGPAASGRWRSRSAGCSGSMSSSPAEPTRNVPRRSSWAPRRRSTTGPAISSRRRCR